LFNVSHYTPILAASLILISVDNREVHPLQARACIRLATAGGTPHPHPNVPGGTPGWHIHRDHHGKGGSPLEGKERRGVNIFRRVPPAGARLSKLDPHRNP